MKISFVILMLAAGYVLLDTRLGVFLVFDVLGDLFEQSDNYSNNFSDSPISYDDSLTSLEARQLPDLIEQASGIVKTPDELLVSTDQAELFLVATSGEITNRIDLLKGPLLLKQGSLEAITWDKENQVLVLAGELDELPVWKRRDNSFERVTSLTLNADLKEKEFSGVTGTGGDYWLVSGDESHLYQIQRQQIVELDASPFLKEGRDLVELAFSGISTDPATGITWIAAEAYPSILAVDLTDARILATYWIDAPEPSDIAVLDNVAYVTNDHNYFDDRPPVNVYQLPPITLPAIGSSDSKYHSAL